MTRAVDGTDGIVLATALSPDGRTLYIGGQFSRVGSPSGSFVVASAADGAPVSHPIVNGIVKAQVPDGSGGWYIGGNFTRIDGTAHKALAHVRADGSVDPQFSGIPGLIDVSALALDGATLFVSATVTTTLQQPVPNLVVAVDAASGTSVRWTYPVPGSVRCLAAGANLIYLGGEFAVPGALEPQYLTALDKTTGAAVSWKPSVSNGSGVPVVNTLVPSGSVVYVGGQFTAIGGAARSAAAALDAVSGATLPWNAGLVATASATVNALVVDGASVYLAGEFIQAGGQSRTGIAVVDASSAAVRPWDAALGADSLTSSVVVTAMAVSGDAVYAAGVFSAAPLGPVRTAAFDKSTAAARTWVDAGPSAFVRKLDVQGSKVAVGGHFALLSGAARKNIAAIDTSTGRVTSWNPDSPSTDGDVNTGVVLRLLAVGDKVYAAGQIKRIGGADRQSLAALDPVTGAALPWNAQIAGTVTAMAASDSTLYVGGQTVSSAGGQPRTCFAAFDLATGALSGWAPTAGVNSSINQMAATGSIVYVAGAFKTINGQARSCVAAVDAASGALLPWSADVTSTFAASVSGIALDGNQLYVVGSFEKVAGQFRTGLAAVDAGTGALLSWPQNIGISTPRAVAAQGDRVYISGSGGGGEEFPAQAVFTVSASQGTFVPTQFVLEGYVDTISVSANGVYFGGSFTEAARQVAPNLACYVS